MEDISADKREQTKNERLYNCNNNLIILNVKDDPLDQEEYKNATKSLVEEKTTVMMVSPKVMKKCNADNILSTKNLYSLLNVETSQWDYSYSTSL